MSAELRLDIEVPKGRGVVRLAAGPQAAVWVAGSTGLPRPGSALFAQPAAFVCTQKSCSSPIRKPELLLSRANQLAQ